MIKKILFSFLLSFVAIGAIAQISQGTSASAKLSDRIDQVMAMKIGYMADQMQLTSEQSVAFWPLYNEYWKARFSLFDAKRKAQNKIDERTAVASDIEELIRVEQGQADLMRKYVPKFEKVISTDQTAKMFVAEEKFKSVLLRSLK